MTGPTAPGVRTLSGLIGAIHDCALVRDLWPGAMERVCRAFGFVARQLYVVDFDTGAHRVARGWGQPPEAGRGATRRERAGGALRGAEAAALGIALTTAKTPLARVLGKAGAARPSDLRALVARLCPPVGG